MNELLYRECSRLFWFGFGYKSAGRDSAQASGTSATVAGFMHQQLMRLFVETKLELVRDDQVLMPNEKRRAIEPNSVGTRSRQLG